MKLEKQVVNLELAKKLKELGFKQESLFYWSDGGELKTEEEYYNFMDYAESVGKPAGTEIQKHYPAYTVAELGEMLTDIQFTRKTHKNVKEKWVCYDDVFYNIKQLANTEADARAKMLIYLKENKLI